MSPPKIKTFEVIEKPDPTFPLESGSIINMPTHHYEWAHKGEIYQCDLSNDKYFRRIDTDEERREKVSLYQIANDYNKLGYVEDFQIEWMIKELQILKGIIIQFIDNSHYIGHGINKIEITDKLLDEYKEKVNYGS